MRKVYQPRKSITGTALALFGSVVLTAVLFGLLPFAHQVAKPQSTLEMQQVGRVDVTPPPEDTPPPPPQTVEEEKPPEKPPEPELSEAPVQINLNASLEGVTGGGGVLNTMAVPFSAQEAIQQGGGIEDKVFDVADLDKQPEVLAAISPAYPSDMRKAKVEGKVTILFVLTEEGRVEDPRVESASRPEFEKAALDAVRKWKFRPGSRGGEAVRTYMKLPIAFTLRS